MSYHPAWLQLALETVFGEVITFRAGGSGDDLDASVAGGLDSSVILNSVRGAKRTKRAKASAKASDIRENSTFTKQPQTAQSRAWTARSHALKRFIVGRLLCDPDVMARYGNSRHGVLGKVKQPPT
jgi:hypothetical protein